MMQCSTLRRRLYFTSAWLLVTLWAFPLWAADAGQTADSSTGDTPAKSADFGQLLMEVELGTIPLWRYAAGLGCILLGLVFRGLIVTQLTRPLKLLFKRTETEFDDAVLQRLRAPLSWLEMTAATWFGLLFLGLPAKLEASIGKAFVALATVLMAWLVFRLIDVGVAALDSYAEGTESTMDDQLVPVVRRALRVIIVLLTGLLIVQQLGYNITSLIAGLGIGGLAVALAAREMLANWFGSIMIFTDRPFQVGDWVKNKHGEGTVAEVGLRSTRIETFDKTMISVPNSDMANSAVENLQNRPRWRVNNTVGLVYSTTHDQLQEVLTEFEAFLREHDMVDSETVRVHFSGFLDSSLEISFAAFFHTDDIAVWRELREEVFLKLMEIVENAGTDFAFPSRSIYIESDEDLSGRMDG
jgi:MscS family membrane protein